MSGERGPGGGKAPVQRIEPQPRFGERAPLRRRKPRVQPFEPSPGLGQARRGVGEAQLQAVESLVFGEQTLAQRPLQAPRQQIEFERQFGPALAHQHRRAGGGGGAHVGHQIGDAHVGFVPDAAHDRHGACGDRAGKRLVVVGHEIFGAAAAAHEQCRFDAEPRRSLAKECKRCHHLRRRFRALHQRGQQHDLDEGGALAQRAQHVMDGVPCRRGDEGDAPRPARQGPLPFSGEEPLGFELGSDGEETLPQQTGAGRLEAAHHQLVLASRGIDAQLARCLHAVSLGE